MSVRKRLVARSTWLALCTVVIAHSARADSGLNGCLYVMDSLAVKWSADEWKQEVSYMQQAGLRNMILVGPGLVAASLPSATAPVSEPHDSPHPIIAAADRLMAAAKGTDLRVYFSVWSHPQWYGRWNLDEELATNQVIIERLANRYGRLANFGGWYIPHEIYVVWGEQARYITGLYAGLSKLCKTATPDKTVILSPFFILDRDGHLGDFRFVEPAEYEAFWYELLRQTQIDVVALQDSGEHLSFFTLDDRRPFFAAMKRACTRAGKQLWINIETGELHADSYADYERKFGRKTHVNDPKTQAHWRVVAPDKLESKLDLAHEFTPVTMTWGYREYWDPMRGPQARNAYDAYLRIKVPASKPRAGLPWGPQTRPDR